MICGKNCCCLIFLDTCFCGLHFTPQLITAAFSGGKHFGDKTTATGVTDSASDNSASKKPKLWKSLTYGSMRDSARRCSHGPPNKAGESESCQELPKMRVKARNDTADPQNREQILENLHCAEKLRLWH